MTIKDKLIKMIAESEAGNVLRILLEATQRNGQKELNSDLVHLSSRYKRNEVDSEKGIIDKSDYKLEYNRINIALQSYLEKYEDNGTILLSSLDTKPLINNPILHEDVLNNKTIPDNFIPLSEQSWQYVPYNEKRFSDIAPLISQGIILLVTATDTETLALHKKMTPLPTERGLLEIKKVNATYFIGLFGNFVIAHVECGDMGTSTSSGSIITVSNAINFLQPKFVLMVGIAFGVDPGKQNIGDVLVSKNIIPYEVQRVSNNEIVWRGSKPEASNYLRNVFKNLRSWDYTLPNGQRANLELCEILSGEKLVDNIDFRKELQHRFPNAKGGEMEGAGVYAACQDKNVSWILVKSICDFADGEKSKGKKEKQALAIETALNACLHAFNKKFVFEDLGIEAYEEIETLKVPVSSISNTTQLSVLKNKLLLLLEENQQNGIADILVSIKMSDFDYDKVKYIDISNSISTLGIVMLGHSIIQSTKILIHSLKEKS